MPGEDVLALFKRAQKEQLAGRTMGEYVPCSAAAMERSDAGYRLVPRSFGFQLAATFQHRVSPIVFLYGSAKMMFLAGEERSDRTIAPSEVFGAVSDEFLAFLDRALSEAPVDLLVLHSMGGVIDLGDIQTSNQLIEHVKSLEGEAEGMHSLWLLQAKLMRLHVERISATGFMVLRRALLYLDAIGLFHEDQVSPLALDVFPSLEGRKEELLARRQALQWKPESRSPVDHSD